jgi:hypothetical protein
MVYGGLSPFLAMERGEARDWAWVVMGRVSGVQEVAGLSRKAVWLQDF